MNAFTVVATLSLIGAALAQPTALELECTASDGAGFSLSRNDFSGSPKMILGQLAQHAFSSFEDVLRFADVDIVELNEAEGSFEENAIAFRGSASGKFKVNEVEVEAELMGTGLALDDGYRLQVCGCKQTSGQSQVNFCTDYLVDEAQVELNKLKAKYDMITAGQN